MSGREPEERWELLAGAYLPLLVDDGNCVLQLDIVEQTPQEDVGHANQTVVLLLVKEWVCPPEIRTHHLGGEDGGEGWRRRGGGRKE